MAGTTSTNYIQQCSQKDILSLYEQMLFIRRFLEKVDVLYRQGQVHGPTHLGIGQEAIAVGTASLLTPNDYSIGTYRGHAHALARGASAEGVLAELLGRSGGICGGKGGSMHITSVEHGYYGSYAIVGAHIPIACGLAWATHIRHSSNVTVCFFGDGAVNIGAFHEGLNLAALWSLPVVFVCENNQYMEYSATATMLPIEQCAADRASAYGLDPLICDGNDVHAVREVVGSAVENARMGRGPALIQAETYRFCGHSAADPGAYRSPDEVALWKARDPILRERSALMENNVADRMLDALDNRISSEIDAMSERVLAAPRPDSAQAWRDVWSDGSWQWRN